MIIFSRELSIPFATGQINGYFENEIPKDFFETLALYVADVILFSIVWAIPFGSDNVHAKAITLPVKYENDFIVYKKDLYVTNNKGQTWIKVLNNYEVGYAKINDYLDNISINNIYVSKDKIAIVYGGKGSENISIIYEDSDTNYWGVGTISKTATHDLKKGYDNLYIDFA